MKTTRLFAVVGLTLAGLVIIGLSALDESWSHRSWLVLIGLVTTLTGSITGWVELARKPTETSRGQIIERLMSARISKSFTPPSSGPGEIPTNELEAALQEFRKKPCPCFVVLATAAAAAVTPRTAA